jgi:hypothetical protein
MPTVHAVALLAALTLMLAIVPVAAQEPPAPTPVPETPPPPVVELPGITVFGSTPLPALGTPLDKYPGNVQSLSPDEPWGRNLPDLPESLFRRLGSVNINNNQGNPFQNDVTYRGFLASPLVGSAIGLSVYLDGMRFNDGFGDTVSWDLIHDWPSPGSMSSPDPTRSSG